MKHSVLLFILVAVICSQVLGNPVDENTAKQLAQNFWRENNIMGVRGDKVFKKRMDDARFMNVAPQIGYSEFYVFNNEDGDGFVIIAADDCVTPILAYSYNDNFVTDTLSPELKWWLDGYAEQIQIAVDLRATATDDIRTDWECLRQGKNLPIKSETMVEPLVTTEWGQNDYYNALCPSVLGFHTPTGCVATAMAQIMKYWNYPIHGYNYHSYECWPYGTQSANFAGTNYQWSSMPNQVTSSNIAVATLMYHCGVSVEMDYGINESGAAIISDGGANEYCAENALKQFFGYSTSLLGVKKNDYLESTWINILKSELDNLRPILYGGQGNNGGHAFVCDGYNNSNMFHFNWGWNGAANNAWFYINNLNPTDSYNYTHNYSYYQHALIGIQPDSDLQGFNLVLYDDVQMVGDNNGNYDFGQTISSYAEILNNGNSTFSGYIAAAVFDDDAYFIDFLGGGYTSLEPNYWTSDIVEHEGGIPFLPSYDYLYHTIMFYSVDGTYWSMVNPGNYDNDAVFQVFNNGEDIVTNSEFTFSNGEDNVIYNNQEITINIDVINEGTETYYGSIWLCLTNYNTNTSQVVDILYIDDGLPPYYHYINGISFTNTISLPVGEYYLELMYVKDDHLYYAGSVFYPCIKRVYVFNAPYTINVSANPSTGGTVSGGGDYLEGGTCSLIATANNNYVFVNWTENGNVVSNSPYYSFPVTCNRYLIANFQYQPPQQCTINVSAYPSEGGTVSGGGTYQQGQTCTISATNSAGFSFVQWNDGVASNPRTITVTQDSTFVAFFRDNNNQGGRGFSVSASNMVIISQGNLQYQASTGTWRFAEHQYDAIGLANSNISSNYDGWIDLFGWGTSGFNHGGVCYQPWSTSLTNQDYYAYGSATYNLYDQTGQADWGYNAISNGGNEINQWRTLTNDEWYYLFNTRSTSTVNGVPNARYAKAQVNNTHGVIIFPDNYSHPSDVTQPVGINETGNAGWNGNNYTANEWISMEANGAVFLPVTGYRDGTTVHDFGAYGNYWSASVYQTHVHTMNFHDTYISQGGYDGSARYHGTGVRLVQNYQEYAILGQAMPVAGGVISGSGLYGSGETCTLTATPNDNYTFVNWTENGAQVSTNASYSFTVTGNRTLVANFTSQSYVITATADPLAGGVITGSGGYNYGETGTLTATANTGYTFINWTKNGTQVSTNSTYSFTVTESAIYVAHFNLQSYSITVAANPNNGGSVTGGGNYNFGQTCTINATASSGFTFTSWTENGSQVSTNANYSFTVTSNRNLVANFTQNTYTIQASAGANGTITPSGTVVVTHGTSQSFSMIPDSGYEVQEIYIDGNPVGAMTSYTFNNVTNDHYIHVVFSPTVNVDETYENDVVLFPNPTSSIVTIKGKGIEEIQVFNVLGIMVKNLVVDGKESIVVDLSGFSCGVYILKLTSDNRLITKQVLKIY